jgi:hypothetical protein
MHAVLLQNGSNATHQVKTEERPEPRHCLAELIKEHSRTAYGMPAHIIELYIRNWYGRSDDLPHIRIKS